VISQLSVLQGLAQKVVRQQADQLLAKVKLTEAANQRSGSYSGGMKRRLSVAIALLGDPKIVFLVGLNSWDRHGHLQSTGKNLLGQS